MRVAVISCPARRMPPPDYVKSLAKGIASMGHQADIIDAWTEDGYKLPAYEYIAVCAESVSFFGGKMPDALGKILSAGSGIGGKKSAAFLKKTSPFTGKALVNLMKAMEHEGMNVNWSEVLFNAPHAEVLGKRIGA